MHDKSVEEIISRYPDEVQSEQDFVLITRQRASDLDESAAVVCCELFLAGGVRVALTRRIQHAADAVLVGAAE